MTKSQVFLYLCLSFVAGIFTNSIFLLPQPFLLGILIFGVFLVSVFWGRKKFVVVGFCLLFLTAGAWRYQSVVLAIPQIVERDVSFIGQIAAEPKIGEKSTKLTVKTDSAKVLVTTDRYPEYRYGDKLKITGRLEAPPVFDEFNYKDYLKKDGIFTVMSWPKIEVLSSGSGSPVIKFLLSFKIKFHRYAPYCRCLRDEYQHYYPFGFKCFFRFGFLEETSFLFFCRITYFVYFDDRGSGLGSAGWHHGRHFTLRPVFGQIIFGGESRSFCSNCNAVC